MSVVNVRGRERRRSSAANLPFSTPGEDFRSVRGGVRRGGVGLDDDHVAAGPGGDIIPDPIICADHADPRDVT